MSRLGAALILALVFLPAGCGHNQDAPRKQALASDNLAAVPGWISREHLPSGARRGAKLFAKLPCLSCHTYANSGESNLDAPDLTAEGSKHRGTAWQVAHLKCPPCVVDGSPMPSFASLPKRDLRDLAVFLDASKGTS